MLTILPVLDPGQIQVVDVFLLFAASVYLEELTMSGAVSGMLLVGLMAMVGLGLSAFFTKKTIVILLAFWVSILAISIIVVLMSSDTSLYKALIGADNSGMFLVYYGFILGLAARYAAFYIHPCPSNNSQAPQR